MISRDKLNFINFSDLGKDYIYFFYSKFEKTNDVVKAISKTEKELVIVIIEADKNSPFGSIKPTANIQLTLTEKEIKNNYIFRYIL